MKFTVLGCGGGIGGVRRTSSYLLDDDVLLDVGTGAGELSLDQLIGIDHVFLTHAHLDHSGLLPMVVDAASGFRDHPVVVHGLAETLAAIRECMFNWRLWPDYAAVPSPERPFLVYQAIETGQAVSLGTREITPVPVWHSVPATAYRIDSGAASLVLSGDTTFHEPFWQALNGIDNLRYLVIETSYLEANAAMAPVAGHMTARLLAQGLKLLQRPVEVYVTHLEPGREAQTMAEVQAATRGFNVRSLLQEQVIEF